MGVTLMMVMRGGGAQQSHITYFQDNILGRYIISIEMKVFLLALLALLALASAADCPHDLEVRCIDDINKAYPVCDKAAHEKGADVPADLDCLKYFASLDKDCWPCICWVAQLNKWRVKGC